MISACFSSFCLLSSSGLCCGCCLSLLSGVPFLPACSWGWVFSLVILPVPPKPLEHHRAHIRHSLFILLGRSAFTIPPCALPAPVCPLCPVTLSSLCLPFSKDCWKVLQCSERQHHGSCDFLSAVWLLEMLPAEPQVPFVHTPLRELDCSPWPVLLAPSPCPLSTALSFSSACCGHPHVLLCLRGVSAVCTPLSLGTKGPLCH